MTSAEVKNTLMQIHLASPQKLFLFEYILNVHRLPFFPEPGYYEDGSFGIRIENVVLVIPAKPKVNPLTGNQT